MSDQTIEEKADPLQVLINLLTDPNAPKSETFISDVKYAILLVKEHREKADLLTQINNLKK